jgi:poly(3-hydroxybutyrate) depolymerase
VATISFSSAVRRTLGRPTAKAAAGGVRGWLIHYRAHNGIRRPALIVLPAQYGPDHRPPPLPLVISPHGRGVRALTNSKLWGALPALGGFALVCPGGMGRRLPLHSWGYHGQIDDLARMPKIVSDGLPWLSLASGRVYAVGGSMGGHETLLLVGRYPRLLAGAAAFDSVTNFYTRYSDFARIPNGRGLQALARVEVGGTPQTNPTGYVLRSPTHWVQEIARSGVRLQMWWSTADAIVVGQEHQSAHLYAELKKLHPVAPVETVVGTWRHTAEMHANTRLPEALEWLGLLGGV